MAGGHLRQPGSVLKRARDSTNDGDPTHPWLIRVTAIESEQAVPQENPAVTEVYGSSSQKLLIIESPHLPRRRTTEVEAVYCRDS
jgi:hypothetical protein